MLFKLNTRFNVLSKYICLVLYYFWKILYSSIWLFLKIIPTFNIDFTIHKRFKYLPTKIKYKSKNILYLGFRNKNWRFNLIVTWFEMNYNIQNTQKKMYLHLLCMIVIHICTLVFGMYSQFNVVHSSSDSIAFLSPNNWLKLVITVSELVHFWLNHFPRT